MLFSKLSNKKASLEISIQAIVIVVLAMTILGLGLGFVRNMFKNIGSTTEDVTEQVRQRVLDDLISGDKKVSFPKTEVVVDKGGSTTISVGIRNKKDQALHYKLQFTPIKDPEGNNFDIETKSWFQYAKDTTYTLSPADSEVRNVRLTIPSDVKSGSYFLTFDIIDDDLSSPDDIYAQKDFFIVVRG